MFLFCVLWKINASLILYTIVAPFAFAFKGEKTLIIVAHRLSTVENCDRLYKLEKGRVIEEGIPRYVLKTNTTG